MPDVNPLSIGEMTITQIVWDRFKRFAIRLRRKLPYLVWYNDELDVCITLSQDKLPDMEMSVSGISADNFSEAFRPLFSGTFAEIEKKFREMGITFDTGMGGDGRDWEWDWSLKGPIHIKFRGRASKPLLRKERPRPTLAFTKPAA